MAEALTAAGTSRVRADFLSGEATLEADGVHDDVLRTAVEQAGYRVLGLEDVEEREGGPVHRRGPRGRKRYDLLILGSGSAAFAAAIKAKDLGATVALCESNAIGGTCVNIGCVPSKAMLSAADVFHKAGNNPFPGVRTSAGRLNLRALVEWKDSLVDEMRAQKYENLAAEYGFTCFCGHGEFTGPGSYVCDGKQVEADKFIVATGASPAAPPIPGLDEAGYLTSTTALERRKLPATLAVIGANAIGPEMGQLFLRLGGKVTVLEALARVAPFEEPEISTAIGEALTDEGADVRPGVRITRVERNERGRAVV